MDFLLDRCATAKLNRAPPQTVVEMAAGAAEVLRLMSARAWAE